jgi:hypothetical protein
MSWSISAIGKAPAVARALRKQISGPLAIQSEEDARERLVSLAEAQLAEMGEATIVKFNADGSAYSHDGLIIHTSHFALEPIYGFVE